MPYKTQEEKAEALRRWRARKHEVPTEVPKSLGEVPESKVAKEAVEVPPLVKSRYEVPGYDGKKKVYDPGTDGVDGWHETEKGMKYILQDTGMGGHERLYRPGPRMFSYR